MQLGRIPCNKVGHAPPFIFPDPMTFTYQQVKHTRIQETERIVVLLRHAFLAPIYDIHSPLDRTRTLQATTSSSSQFRAGIGPNKCGIEDGRQPSDSEDGAG